MSKKNSLLIVALIILGVMVLSYSLLGVMPLIIFSIFLLGGLIVWLKTTYHYPIHPDKLIIPYILTVIFFIIHVLEEYLMDFAGEMTQTFPFNMTEFNFLIIAAFCGPILWLSGALLLLMRNPIGYFITWGFFIAMVFSELAHFIFPFFKEGPYGYFPGMYTAILPLIPAVYSIFIILKELRSIKYKIKFNNYGGEK